MTLWVLVTHKLMLYLMESTSWKSCNFNTKSDPGRCRQITTGTSSLWQAQLPSSNPAGIVGLAFIVSRSSLGKTRDDLIFMMFNSGFVSGTPKTRYIHHLQTAFAENWKVKYNILQYFREYKNGSIKSVYAFVALLLQRRSKTVLQNIVY